MTDLTPENNYQFPPTPAPAALGRDAWNAVMGSLSARIRELEAQRTELQDLISDLSYNAQIRIDEAITPLISDVEISVAAIAVEIDRLQEAVDLILAGGIPADSVVESPTRRFWTPEGAAELQGALDAIAAMGVATKEDAEAGENNAKRMTALRVSQAIDALAGSENTINVTADLAMKKGKRYRLVGSAALTLTLPGDPVAGDTVRVVDGESIALAGTHTVARNGKTIMGLAENLTLNVQGIAVTIWYSGSDWRLF